jgi:hypothetical protein
MGRMSMVDPRDALAGRPTAMAGLDKNHFILGNPIKGPFPEGLKTCM